MTDGDRVILLASDPLEFAKVVLNREAEQHRMEAQDRKARSDDA